MDGHGIESRAATALRTYEGRLLRAQQDHNEARKAFEQTAIDLEKAEAAYEAAKHVYQAGDADRTRDLGLDKIGALTLAWIKQLIAYSDAGTAELKDAAEAVGWNASPAAIRQQAKRLTERGVFVRVGDGVYRVSERVRKLLKDRLECDSTIIDDDHAEGTDGADITLKQAACDTPPIGQSRTTAAISENCDSQVVDASQEESSATDEYDDDLPF